MSCLTCFPPVPEDGDYGKTCPFLPESYTITIDGFEGNIVNNIQQLLISTPGTNTQGGAPSPGQICSQPTFSSLYRRDPTDLNFVSSNSITRSLDCGCTGCDIFNGDYILERVRHTQVNIIDEQPVYADRIEKAIIDRTVINDPSSWSNQDEVEGAYYSSGLISIDIDGQYGSSTASIIIGLQIIPVCQGIGNLLERNLQANCHSSLFNYPERFSTIENAPYHQAILTIRFVDQCADMTFWDVDPIGTGSSDEIPFSSDTYTKGDLFDCLKENCCAINNIPGFGCFCMSYEEMVVAQQCLLNQPYNCANFHLYYDGPKIYYESWKNALYTQSTKEEVFDTGLNLIMAAKNSARPSIPVSVQADISYNNTVTGQVPCVISIDTEEFYILSNEGNGNCNWFCPTYYKITAN